MTLLAFLAVGAYRPEPGARADWRTWLALAAFYLLALAAVVDAVTP